MDINIPLKSYLSNPSISSVLSPLVPFYIQSLPLVILVSLLFTAGTN
jgi:hypothetical protein